MWKPGSERTGDRDDGTDVPRRGFIALVCAAGVAGCSEVELPGQGPVDGPTDPQNGTDVGTPTPTDRADGTATDTDTPEETANTETDTDTETEEPTETPSEEERAERALASAETRLETAFGTYASHSGSGGSLLDVTATATGFPASGVIAATERADEDLAEVQELGTSKQRSRAKKFGKVSKFLRLAATCQAGVTDAYDAFQQARTRYREGEDGGLAALDRMREAWTPVREESLPALDRVDVLAMSAFDPMNSEDANRKVDQFDAELETFATLRSPVRRLGEGAALFRSGLELYAIEEYNDAESDLRDAESALEGAKSAGSNIESTDALRSDITALKDVIKVLAEAADLYQSAAQQNDEDRGSGDNEMEEAEELLAENPAAEEWVR